MISRRFFIKVNTLASAAAIIFPKWIMAAGKNNIMSVQGRIDAAEMGITLVHEHILVDFIGADQVDPSRYNSEEVYKIALPYLKELKALGCNTLIECTPSYLGKDPLLLKKLAEAANLNIITNTGYYGAVNHKFIPKHGFSETAEQLAARWIGEWENGLKNTGIRPGFIKISGDKGPITAIQQKLVKAAALTHLKTGLTITMHTGDGIAAEEEVKIVNGNGVAGQAFIWVHAQNEKDTNYHINLAKKGIWVEFDGLNPENINQYIDFVLLMKKNNLLHRTLIAHDAGWYHVGEPNGGNFRGFTFAFTDFIPGLLKKGITKKEIDQLFRDNPSKAFAINIRKV